MADTCPTCGRTDGEYSQIKTALCRDPWHADAHLRRAAIANRLKAESPGPLEIGPDTLRKAADVHNATTIRMRADHARACFEHNLAAFVKMWAPDPYKSRESSRDCERFQRDLMMLFRDAMEHKSMTFGLHMERTDTMLDALSMHATGSLQAIYKEKP